MLKNHGPVVMGKTLTEAFIKYWALQRACEIQLATMSMGKPITVPNEVVAVHQRDLFMASIPGQAGKAEFDAMVRKVDKIDTSWRDSSARCAHRGGMTRFSVNDPPVDTRSEARRVGKEGVSPGKFR